VARGLPHARGLSHGQQAKEKIRANVSHYKLPGQLTPGDITSKIIHEVYIPAIKTYFPSGLEEMQGIADGAEVSLEDIIILNARYDLARITDDFLPPQRSAPSDDQANECTSAVFVKENTVSGDVICAQNWDMSSRLWLDDTIIYLEVHPDPSENKPSMFFVTEAGQLGRSGMNSVGMAVTANSLMSTDDYVPISHMTATGIFVPVEPKPVLPISLLRRMFLECSHLSEGLVAIDNFPRHVSNNLTISTSDSTGYGMCLEITPDRVYKVYSDIDTAYIVHTNHFIHPGFQSRSDIRDRYPGGSSWFRHQQFTKGIHPYRRGQLDNSKIISAFSDHLSYPESVCCHPEENPVDSVISKFPGYPFRGSTATVACVLYNLSQSTITVCKGPPCQGVFTTFHLKGQPKQKIVNGHAASNGHGRARPDLP
jgi:isopenicillin-N N-acyltransferase-like protein